MRMAMIAVACLLTADAAEAAVVSHAPQLKYNGFSKRPFPIAAFAFDSESVRSKAVGMPVTIRFTLGDGDTGPGDYDEGHLTLALDGYATGLVLDGFERGRTMTLTLRGGTFTSDMLRALRKDGTLVASIVDSDPNENRLSLYSTTPARLTLTPVPAASALLGVALASLVALRRRRSRA